MKYANNFFYGCVAALLIGLCSCAGKPQGTALHTGTEAEIALASESQKTSPTSPVEPVPAQPAQTSAPQAKPAKADKKPPAVIALGDIAEIETLGSFIKLAQKKDTDLDYEKARIEYLLERLSKTAYNLLRNGETHDSKKAVLLMRYKWAKFKSEVNTAEDFVEKIAAGSRHSGEPYYVKANNRYYLVKDVLFYELELLKQALLRYNERQIN